MMAKKKGRESGTDCLVQPRWGFDFHLDTTTQDGWINKGVMVMCVFRQSRVILGAGRVVIFTSTPAQVLLFEPWPIHPPDRQLMPAQRAIYKGPSSSL
jgi:hypothetical protein